MIMIRNMNPKWLIALSFVFCHLAVGTAFTSCTSDDGNYDYLPDSEVDNITLTTDSDKVENPYAIYSLTPGAEVEYYLKVDYPHAERLQYTWFVLHTGCQAGLSGRHR